MFKRWRFEFEDLDLGEKRDLHHEIDEWKEFGVSFGREEKTSIVKSYNVSFTFIREDCWYLREIVFTRGFSARIGLNIYLTDKDRGGDEIYYKCRLELYNCQMTANTFVCPVYEGGFFTLLDSSWSTKFSVSNRVDGLPNVDFENIDYKGGSVQYTKQMQVSDDNLLLESTLQTGNPHWNVLPLQNLSSNSQVDGFFYETQYLSCKAERVGIEQMFVCATTRNESGKLKINGDLELEVRGDWNNKPAPQGFVYTGFKIDFIFMPIAYRDKYIESWDWSGSSRLWKAPSDPDEKTFSTTRWQIYGVLEQDGNEYAIRFYNVSDNSKHRFTINDLEWDFRWLKYIQGEPYGYYLTLTMMAMSGVGGWLPFTIKNPNINVFYELNEFSLNKGERIIHGIRPSMLFSSLLEQINNNRYNLNVDLGTLEQSEGGLRLFNQLTARGKLEDYETSISTTMGDFLKFCNVVLGLLFCCRYDKNNDTYRLEFRKIADCYTNDKVFSLPEVADMNLEAYGEIIYSNIKVGSNNNNDAFCGFLEYNTINTFKTDNVECEEKVLDMYCTYLLGCFDVETIIFKSKDSDDTNVDSDNIYVVETENGATKIYNVWNGRINMGLNLGISPKRLLQLHEREIKVFTNRLQFVSSERNADVTYLGVKENADMDLSGVVALYKPFILNVSSASLTDMISKIEQLPYGYIEFEIGGSVYQGYIANGTESVSVNPMNEKESDFVLILKKLYKK